MWSPLQIEELLNSAYDTLNEGVADLKAMSEEAAIARSDFEITFSKNVLRAKEAGMSSLDLRKAWALVQSEASKRHFEDATNQHQTQREVLNVTRSQVDLLRTLLVQARGVQDPKTQTGR